MVSKTDLKIALLCLSTHSLALIYLHVLYIFIRNLSRFSKTSKLQTQGTSILIGCVWAVMGRTHVKELCEGYGNDRNSTIIP